MTDTAPHSALRQWGRHMTHPLSLVALGGLAAILALIGPFDTGQVLPLVPRFAYWLTLVVMAYSIGYWSHTLLKPRLNPRWALIWIGLITGLGVSAGVILLNYLSFGIWPDGPDLRPFLSTVIAIAMIVTVVLDYARQHLAAAPQAEAAAAGPPPLLDRLPLDKRGDLVALSVEDHYVRVRTTEGEEMLLMRLSDAIRETGGVAGLQVHRSHWVALDQVTAARRDGDRAILTLSHGGEVPVSRARLPEVKAAGLLPR